MYRKKRSETKLKKREFHELTCTAIVKSGTIGLRLASGEETDPQQRNTFENSLNNNNGNSQDYGHDNNRESQNGSQPHERMEEETKRA